MQKCKEAIQDVKRGKRETADATWWGFDPDNATDALQSAIDSGAKKVLVPNTGQTWHIDPIQLTQNDQELIFEEGAVVAARRGSFVNGGDCLFTAKDMDNITLRGYGAVLMMCKDDYLWGDYERSEHRHLLSFRGCNGVKVFGLTLRESGGDGIYLGRGERQSYNRDILIRDVICDNNHRQGMSVITAEDMLVQNCFFNNTSGTPPRAGIDLEPNRADERLVNIRIKNCIFDQNESLGLHVYLNNLNSESEEVSVLWENCRIRKSRVGINVARAGKDGPRGRIEYRNITVEETEESGIKVYDVDADSLQVIFSGCILNNTSTSYSLQGSPIRIAAGTGGDVSRAGGIRFEDCYIIEPKNIPLVEMIEEEEGAVESFSEITGELTASNPYGRGIRAPVSREGIDLLINDQLLFED